MKKINDIKIDKKFWDTCKDFDEYMDSLFKLKTESSKSSLKHKINKLEKKLGIKNKKTKEAYKGLSNVLDALNNLTKNLDKDWEKK